MPSNITLKTAFDSLVGHHPDRMMCQSVIWKRGVSQPCSLHLSRRGHLRDMHRLLSILYHLVKSGGPHNDSGAPFPFPVAYHI